MAHVVRIVEESDDKSGNTDELRTGTLGGGCACIWSVQCDVGAAARRAEEAVQHNAGVNDNARDRLLRVNGKSESAVTTCAPATLLLTGNFMLQCALRTPVCVLCNTKTDQPSFFHLDPIDGRGVLLAHAKGLDPLEVDWSLSPDGGNVAYLPEHNGNQIGILSMEGKSSRTIVLDGGQLQSPTWAADNEHFYSLVWKILHRGIRYEERGPAVSKASKQKRTRKMIQALRRLGYRVEPTPSQSTIPA